MKHHQEPVTVCPDLSFSYHPPVKEPGLHGEMAGSATGLRSIQDECGPSCSADSKDALREKTTAPGA